MITVVCGTNRNSSNSLIFSRLIKEILLTKNETVQILKLEDLPKDFLFDNEVYGKTEAPLNQLVDKYISRVSTFIFIVPEYNGSFPGVLKGFLDSFMPSRIKGKTALLIGISTGRAGNLRGLDHFTAVLNYLDVEVLPKKIAISHCHTLIDLNNEKIKDKDTIALLSEQVERLLAK